VTQRRKQNFRIRIGRADELAELMRIDDDACAVFAALGLPLSLPADHPFVLADAARWARSLAAGNTFVAVDARDEPIGFAVLALPDGAPYLDELSVRQSAMRGGVGTALLQAALRWSGVRPLWLTTYGHVSFNAPFYERHGFVRVPEAQAGGELRELLASQRAVLPAPEQRVVMVHRAF
jgi:GNAT superfamily N-acetyltransferase